jgi:hypothetical protein
MSTISTTDIEVGHENAEDPVRICCRRPTGRHAWWFGSTIAAMVFQTALTAAIAILALWTNLGVITTIIVVLPLLLTGVAGSVLVCCKRSTAR